MPSSKANFGGINAPGHGIAIQTTMKRGSGEGTWQTLPSGKYRLVVKQGTKKIAGPACHTKAEARAGLARKLQSAAEDASPSLSSYLTRQLAGEYGRGISPATKGLYESLLKSRVVGTPLGSTKVQSIKSADVQAWLDAQPADRSRRNALTMVKSALRRSGVLVDVSIKPLRTKEPRVLSPKEQSALLALDLPEIVRMVILLSMRCGLRRGELCALRHSDRDDDGITIRRTLVTLPGGIHVEKEPKTANSANWVPLPQELLPLIGKRRKGYVVGGGPEPILPRYAHFLMVQALRGTPFANVRLHDLRRTYGMTLLERGVDLRTAAEMMRHDPTMLAKTYARSRRDLKREAVSKAFADTSKDTRKRKTG